MSDEKKIGLMDKIKKMLETTEGLDDDLYYEDLGENDIFDENSEKDLNSAGTHDSHAPILCDVGNSKLHIGSNGAVTVISCRPDDLADIYEALDSILNDNGFINLDFGDVNLSNANGGIVKIYKAFAMGEDCCAVATQMIARNKINADSVILLIEASHDISFMEVEMISSSVAEICPVDSRIAWGVNLNKNKTKTVKVSVLVFDERQ